MGLPGAFGNLHVGEDGGERRLLGRAGIDSEADHVGSFINVANAHLAEIHSILRAFDAVVVIAAREAVPHGLDIGGNSGGCPVGIALVCNHAAEVLELLVLVFDRALHPVLAVEVHDDAALVEAMVALREVGLHHEAEELLTRLHLQDGRIVVLEVIVGALPEVGVRSCGDLDGVALHFESAWFARPFQRIEVNLASVFERYLHVVGKIHNCLFWFIL